MWPIYIEDNSIQLLGYNMHTDIHPVIISLFLRSSLIMFRKERYLKLWNQRLLYTPNRTTREGLTYEHYYIIQVGVKPIQDHMYYYIHVYHIIVKCILCFNIESYNFSFSTWLTFRLKVRSIDIAGTPYIYKPLLLRTIQSGSIKTTH